MYTQEVFMRGIRLAVLVVVFGLIGFQAGAQSDQSLVDRYDRMYASEKYELALKAAETICERYPTSTNWHFKAGALQARLGHPELAIEHLQACANGKYTGISSFEQNSDLDSLRDRDDFQAIVETVRGNAKARMDEFQREAKAHLPESYYPAKVEGEKRPLVIALHGTGMDGKSMFGSMKEACESVGAILIAPDALRPAGDGFSWTYRDESKWFVNFLIERAIEEDDADPDRVILVGFSQGANIALILGQTQPETFVGVVPICGHYESQNAEAKDVPSAFYLMSGARDPWRKTYVKAKRDFEAGGGAVQVRLLAGKGHQLPRGKSGTNEYSRAIKWCLDQGEGD